MMLIKQSILAFSLLILGAAAIKDTEELPTSRCQSNWRKIAKRLSISQNKWNKKAPSTACYNMTLQKQCNCLPEYTGPHALQIVGGEIKNTTLHATEMPTVAGLFDLVNEYCVKDCPSSGAARCHVRFDGQYGYVTSLWIDVSEIMADEEIG